MAMSAAAVHVICNANKQDQGVRAARTMLRLLGRSQRQIKRSA
jgi:hypothetical protein